MNHGRSCYLTWMRGAIWRAATSLPSQPEAAVGRQKYRSRLLLRMPRFASNLARPARKVKHTLACAVPPSVRSPPRVRFRSTQTSALGRLQPFRASLPKPHSLHRNNQDLADYFSAKLDQSPQTPLCLSILVSWLRPPFRRRSLATARLFAGKCILALVPHAFLSIYPVAGRIPNLPGNRRTTLVSGDVTPVLVPEEMGMH